HCGVNFPLWLAPEQVEILPISEKFHDYAEELKSKLNEEDIRGLIDQRDEKIGRKIRDAEVSKVPYMLIVGEKEQQEGTVSVRRHGEGDVGSMKVKDFITHFHEESAV
ncbi:MAG: His/Gly/Thr/Pro-type tRNA ligase C-terminal domain-containing protein, partial [Fulvivirga sp.]|nr:His/Gly/Thr/Pro-type tRNA ligase C-terminal domain-containing protein [Fulvivirga sp.]